jgi:hypothetical protein
MDDHSGVSDTNVPHEGAVDDAIDAEMRRTSTHVAIADPASPGAAYVQAEAVAVRDAVVAILAVLRDAELIPSS